MAVVTVAFEDLDAWLQEQPENTASTPYELNITELTVQDLYSSFNTGTLGYILHTNNFKYVDLSATVLPSGVTSLSATFQYCATLVEAPIIPDGVISADYAFASCTALVHKPILPSSVVDDTDSFDGVITNNWKGTELQVNDFLSPLSTSTDGFEVQVYNNDRKTLVDTYLVVGVNRMIGYLRTLPDNTVNNPYKIKIVGLTSSDFTEYGQSNQIRNGLHTNLSKYVDLRYTVIPNVEIDNMSLTSLFYDCTNLIYSAILSDGITKLDHAFIGCTNLKEAPLIPNSVTSLRYGFKWCTSLEKPPFISNAVTNMDYMFEQCTSLVYKPIIPSSVTSSTDCYKGVTQTRLGGSTSQLESFVASQATEFDVVEIEADTENNCYEMTGREVWGVDLGNVDTLLLSLDANTTETSYGLKVLNIPQSYLYLLQSKLAQAEDRYVDLRYTTYPYYASIKDQYGLLLLGCENVVYPPVLPEGITDITSAFSGCTNLKEAPTIPSTVLGLASTFYGCESLTSAPTIPSGVTSLANTFSGCTGLSTPPTIPSSVIYMNGTFSGCTSLTETPSIPSTVTNVNGAFKDCTSLTTVTNVPTGATSLKEMFKGCVSLDTAPTIPSGVTTLEGTFYDCSLIEEVESIPNTVTNMKECFRGCTSLEVIHEFGVSLSTIQNNEDDFQDMFKGCSSLVQIGYKIDEAEQWHIFRLKFGSSTVEGEIYDKSGNSVDINNGSAVSITKSTLTLPIKTDEVWFPTGYADDDDIDEIIEKVIANKYTYFKKETIPPNEKTMILWADDKDHFMTNIEMGSDMPVYDTLAEAEADLTNLDVGQIIAYEEGGDGTVDVVQSGDMRAVTSNAVAQAMGTSLDDENIVDITSQVTKYLGVTLVQAKRKNNLVYLFINGEYTGQPTTSSQNFIAGLPSKYRPSFDQSGFSLCGYNSSQKTVLGRGGINTNGNITLGETAWNNGTQIRSCFIYMI